MQTSAHRSSLYRRVGAARALSAGALSLIVVLSLFPAAQAGGRDTDRDGMPNKWEVAKRLNPRVNDARKDPDRDKLTNIQEYKKRTHPRRADTDGDGFKDGREVKVMRTNPRNALDPLPRCVHTGRKPASLADYKRPATAVVVDNSPQGRPQTGLDAADVVIEQPVEGGMTRLLAVYQCATASKVGPVRSARFNDPALLASFTKVLAYSGANDRVAARVARDGLVSVTEANKPAAFTRTTDAVAPLNLFVSTAAVTSASTTPPKALFAFGSLVGPSAPATQVSLNLGGTEDVDYSWSGSAWLRSQGSPPPVPAVAQTPIANVLVLEVNVTHSNITDSNGVPSPALGLAAGGKALLFRDGKVIEATWTHDATGFVFKRATGDPLRLARGQTWIEMVPSATGDVKGSISYNAVPPATP